MACSVGIHADERIEDLAVDRRDRLQTRLCPYSALIAIAHFDGFMRPVERTGGHRGAAHRAVFDR